MRNVQTFALMSVLVFAGPALAEAPVSQYQNLLSPLASGGVDILGKPLAYPPGEASVTGAIVTIPPGGSTGWHDHEVPLFAYILEGELTVDYGEKGKNTYRAGDSVLEAVGHPHIGTNTGTVPMRLVAVYMGSTEAKNTIPVPAP